MADQLAVEVNVKNVTDTVQSSTQDKLIYFVWIVLHCQMTEKIAFEVRPKKGKNFAKSVFLKSVF